MAVSREWKGLLVPGVIVGLPGYAVEDYPGFGAHFLVRSVGLGL